MLYQRMILRLVARLLCVSFISLTAGLGFAQESHDEETEMIRSRIGEELHDEQEQAHGDPNPLAVDPDLAIWTGVVFCLLFAVLSIFAWPQISAALVEREKRIESNIAAAEAKHEEAKRLLLEHEARLASAADEVRALLEEARRDAEHTKVAIIEEANAAAEKVHQRALLDVRRAADQAMKVLAETSANLAVDLAGRVVQTNITPEQQSQLVRDALDRLAASSPSQN